MEHLPQRIHALGLSQRVENCAGDVRREHHPSMSDSIGNRAAEEAEECGRNRRDEYG